MAEPITMAIALASAIYNYSQKTEPTVKIKITEEIKFNNSVGYSVQIITNPGNMSDKRFKNNQQRFALICLFDKTKTSSDPISHQYQEMLKIYSFICEGIKIGDNFNAEDFANIISKKCHGWMSKVVNQREKVSGTFNDCWVSGLSVSDEGNMDAVNYWNKGTTNSDYIVKFD